jgi:ubiquinone/menaquinone biosynthesis C-methylase UbiE
VNDSDAKTILSTTQAADVLREWRESASYWQKHAGTIRTMFAPLTGALIEAAQIVQGNAVLDVAGGAGEPSLTIAEVVGPTGSVMYTDIAPEMVVAAKSDAQQRGLTNVRFEKCAADSLPFESNSFDAVVCRLGAMFFPDPDASLQEILRVTKQGCNIAFAVWGKKELNPFTYVAANVVAQYFEADTSTDTNAPDAFRFAEPGSLSKILSRGGAVEVEERALVFNIAAPISPEGYWEMRSQISGSLREKLAKLSANDHDRIARGVLEAVREFFPNGHMNFPAQMIVVSGKKPLREGDAS